MARPKGAINKDKPFREALRMAVAEAGDDLKSLRHIAQALITKAASGDVQAASLIADRLDGKATQGVELAGEGGGPVVIKWDDKS